VKARALAGDAADSYVCRLLDRRGTYAALVIDDRSEHPTQRSYLLALQKDGAWWGIDGADVTFSLDGDDYYGGNCCHGKAGAPTYDLETRDRDGVHIVVVKADRPLQRVVTGPGWVRPTDDPAFALHYRNEMVA
jgi:hypothetical protein